MLHEVEVKFSSVLTDSELQSFKKHFCLRVEVPHEPGGDSTFTVNAKVVHLKHRPIHSTERG